MHMRLIHVPHMRHHTSLIISDLNLGCAIRNGAANLSAAATLDHWPSFHPNNHQISSMYFRRRPYPTPSFSTPTTSSTAPLSPACSLKQTKHLNPAPAAPSTISACNPA